MQVFAWSERPGGAGWEKKLIHDFKVRVLIVGGVISGSMTCGLE